MKVFVILTTNCIAGTLETETALSLEIAEKRANEIANNFLEYKKFKLERCSAFKGPETLIIFDGTKRKPRHRYIVRVRETDTID